MRLDDDYPDDYEQALIDTLDASELVVEHHARIDGGARNADREGLVTATVKLPVDTSTEELADLILELLAVRPGERLAGFRFQPATEGPWEWELAVEGELDAGDVDALARFAIETPWQIEHLQGATTTGHAEVDTAAAARTLLQSEGAAWLRERANVVEVWFTIETGRRVLLQGLAAVPDPGIVDYLNAGYRLQENLPTPGAELYLDNRTRQLDDGSVGVFLPVQIWHADLGSGSEAEQRRVAEELGYRELCRELQTLADRSIPGGPEMFGCRVNDIELI